MPAYKLAFLNHPRILVVMFLLLGIILALAKSLNDAESLKLRRKTILTNSGKNCENASPGVERYVTEQFLTVPRECPHRTC